MSAFLDFSYKKPLVTDSPHKGPVTPKTFPCRGGFVFVIIGLHNTASLCDEPGLSDLVAMTLCDQAHTFSNRDHVIHH